MGRLAGQAGRTDGTKFGGTMQDQGSPAQVGQSAAIDSKRHSERTVWIITGYVASGLALLGVFAYYFSVYVTK